MALKPCPFCGGPASIDSWYGGHMVMCKNGGCSVHPSTPEHNLSAKQAAKAWNRRKACAHRWVSVDRGQDQCTLCNEVQFY